MSDERLNDIVDEFRTAVEKLQLSDENRGKITELLGALEKKLEAPDDEEHHHTLVEHVKDSYNRFKAEHADATVILNRILHSLGEAGI